MTLIYSRLLASVKVYVHAKFHQAKCSGSCVIVLTLKKTYRSGDAENNTVGCRHLL